IDMFIPAGGGPPPHRHDFEEMFTILEGEIEFTFRGKKNAPHAFRNVSESAVRLLCMCSPAGQEEFFSQIGVPVSTRTAQPPKPTEAEQAAFREKAEALASKYRTELLPPSDDES
ncbi:cupin domain-containing protein, partial [bacterium]